MASGHLTQAERYQVHALRRAGLSQAAIARQLDRHRSTISRELRRNSDEGGYHGKRAHQHARRRRRDASSVPRIAAGSWAMIESLLQEDHSPEQIAGRTGLASHERIYQHIAADHRAGGSLHKLLRRSRPRRRRRCRPDRRGQIRFRRDISERPVAVDERQEVGHWEIDTMVKAAGGEVLVTMTERVSRVHLIRKAPSRSARDVTRAIISALYPLRDLVLSLTADNGKEFTEHEIIAIALEADFFFARPYASWQRGSNENANGLVRQYLPKGTDFATVTCEQIREIERKLCTRPRKILNYQTPLEVLTRSEAYIRYVATQS